MKNIYKKSIIAVIILLSISFIYSYFHVKGNEIYGVSNISLTSSVTITKSYNFIDSEHIYDLDTKQIELLKSLILKSDFRRTLSSTVRVYDKDTYVIFIANNSQDFLRMQYIGNGYITMSNQFNGKYLKVKNNEWKNELDKIIAFSK